MFASAKLPKVFGSLGAIFDVELQFDATERRLRIQGDIQEHHGVALFNRFEDRRVCHVCVCISSFFEGMIVGSVAHEQQQYDRWLVSRWSIGGKGVNKERERELVLLLARRALFPR